MGRKIPIMEAFRDIVESIKAWVDEKNTVVYQEEPPVDTSVLWIDTNDNTLDSHFNNILFQPDEPDDKDVLWVDTDDVSFSTPDLSHHDLMENRDLPNQHPIGAITDLQEQLDKRIMTVNGKAPDENGNVLVNGAGAVDTDTSLTIAGMAADSKAVGDKFKNLSLADLQEDLQHQTVTNDEKNKWNSGTQIDESLSIHGAAADAKVVGEELDKKQPKGNYLIAETDPTVPAWAKRKNKPEYTPGEVGADPVGTAESAVTNHNLSSESHTDIREKLHLVEDSANRSVKMINGKLPDPDGRIVIEGSGKVDTDETLSVSGMAADSKIVGDKFKNLALRDLAEDAGHRTVTDAEKEVWNSSQQISVDKTLTQSDQSADAKAVRDLMVNKPVSNPNGTKGQILKSDGKGGTEWVDESASQEETDPTVPAWAKKPNPPTASEVGADEKGTASSLIIEHNSDTQAHPKLTQKISANETAINTLKTNKLNIDSVVDDLTTGGTQVPLSAEQGKNLKSQIDGIKVPTQLSELASDESHRTVTDAEKLKWNSSKGVELDATLEDPLKAAQAKVVGDKFKALKIPTKTSELTNDSGFATDVPAWVFDQLEKPTYTDVGADQAGTASSTVQTHNASKTSHKDIRDKINTVETDVKSRIKSINGHTADPETGNIVIDTGSKIDIVEDFESETSKGKAADAFAVGTKLKEYAKTTEIPTVPEWVQQQPNKPTASDIGADAKGTAQSLINAHNSSSEAHQDIRTALAGKLTTDDIVNNLTSTLTNKALSAKQGKELSDKLNGLNLSIIPGTEKARTVTDQEKATWNAKTSVVVDATVTNPGQAADAAAVKELLSGKQDAGDYLIDSDLTSIREDISALQQKITYGTELPVGGKNGDIYIMYEA